VHTQPQPGEAVVAPDVCPFCTSRDIATSSKAVDVSTYWRCTACGQIWNASRLQYGRHMRSDRSGRFG
jgi:transposase-like protein